MARTILVQTASATYDAVVGAGVLGEVGARVRSVSRARCVLLVHDAGLPGELVEAARSSLVGAGLVVHLAPVVATEAGKSLEAAQRLLEAAAEARLERTDAVMALGGGVVGDVAGFVASTYRRGIDLVHCPTTLLAMVDASIGGKTAVNLVVQSTPDHGAGAGVASNDERGSERGRGDRPSPCPLPAAPSLHGERGESLASASGCGGRLLKNMVGTFHQPRLVVVDVLALRTLPARHMRAGLAECVKHAMLAGDVSTPGTDGPPESPDADLALIERFAASPSDPALAIDLIARHIAIKAGVVAIDEREQGGLSPRGPDAFPAREALNLGHTFGHALEALPHLSPDDDAAHAPLHHGEAVGLGLVAATATAEALRQVPPESTDLVRATLVRIGLATRVSGLPGDNALIDAMMDDKKVLGGRLRLILPSGRLGRVRVCEGPGREAVAAGLGAIRG